MSYADSASERQQWGRTIESGLNSVSCVNNFQFIFVIWYNVVKEKVKCLMYVSVFAYVTEWN